MKRVILGLTGASGSIFFTTIFKKLMSANVEIYLIATENGKKVFEYELKMNYDEYINQYNYPHLINCQIDDMFHTIASGSFKTDGMIIVPCSMGTIGKITSGTSDNLLIRACDVQIKEKRPVVIGFRETPLSSIHLNNLTSLSNTGAIIFPLVPAFYNHPKSIEDIVDQIATRILSYFTINIPNTYEWKGF